MFDHLRQLDPGLLEAELLRPPIVIPAAAGLGSIESIIKAGLAHPWEIEFTVASGAGSQNVRVNNPYADGILVVSRYTVTAEGAGALTVGIRSILYETDLPEVDGSTPGRRSAEEDPTKESLTLGAGAVSGNFISTSWDWPGLPLRNGRHLGIVQGGPTGPSIRATASGWFVAPRRRT